MRMGTLTGPRSVTPITPAVLVLTPSIGLLPVSTSSTYTPGARYSATTILLLLEHQIYRRLTCAIDWIDRHRNRGMGAVGGLKLQLGDAAERRQPIIAVRIACRPV